MEINVGYLFLHRLWKGFKQERFYLWYNEFGSFTAEEYQYELKEGYQVDNVVIPKTLLTGGEIGLVLEAHYRPITSIYYKKVGDTVLLSQTRFYD